MDTTDVHQSFIHNRRSFLRHITAGTAGIPFLGKIPFDPNVVSCGDNGISLQEKYADAQVSRAFLELAEKISK